MSSSAVFIQIILPILLILVVILIIVLVLFYRRYHQAVLLKNLVQALRKERVSKLATDLSKVSQIAKANSIYKDLLQNLTMTFDEIDNEVVLADKLILQFLHKTKIVKRSEFDKQVDAINDKIQSINFLESKFTKQAAQVMDQDELLRAEFATNKEFMRLVLEKYREKRLLLDKIEQPILALQKQTMQLEQDFEMNIDAARGVEATQILKNYVTNIIRFCSILNEGPTIQTYLYDQIPQLVVKITDTFKKNYEYLKLAMPMVYFEKTLQSVVPFFEDAKKEFAEVNFAAAQLLIKTVLKTIKTLERQINFELQSKVILETNASTAISEAKIVLSDYQELTKQLKKLSGKGVAIPLEITELFNDAADLGAQLRHKIESFQASAKNAELLFSAKVARGKILAQASVTLLKKVEEISQVIWMLNAEITQARRKFKQAEAAVNEAIANAKKQNILITEPDTKKYQVIARQINNLAPHLLKDAISNELKDEVTILLSNATAFYKTLGASVQIAEMAANLIRHFANLRAIDEKWNQMFVQAENHYLSGRYADALNLIIQRMEDQRRK